MTPWYPAWENTFYDKRMTWFVEEHPRAQEILLIGMQRSPREYICGNYSNRGQATTDKALAVTLESLDKLSPKAVALAFRLPNCEALKHLGAKLAPLRNQGIPLVLIPPKTSAVTESNVPRTLLLQDLYLEEDPNWYRVQSGDTLSMIAYRFHTTVRTLKSLNNLSDDKIAYGQRLLISQKEKESVSHLPTTSLTAIGTLEIKAQDTEDGILRALDLGSRIPPIGVLLADLLNLEQTAPFDPFPKIQPTVQKNKTWRITYSESWYADPKPFHYQSLDHFSVLDNRATKALINDKIVILFDATEESTVRTPRGELVPRAYIHAQVLLNRLTGMTIVTSSWWQTVCLILLGSSAMASLYHISSYRRRSNSNPIIIWLYPVGWTLFLFLILGIGQYLAFFMTQYMIEVIPPLVATGIAAFGVTILTWHQSFARLASRMEDMQSERDVMLDERARLLETAEENTEEILKMDRQLNEQNAAILLLEGDLKQQKDFQRQYLPHKVPLKPPKDESWLELEQEAKGFDIVTRDRTMLQAFHALKELSQNPERPIFISGDTGTGKELYAKASHHLSDRPNGPFKTINMGELTGEKLLSRLFGTAKGAFTGVHGSEGLFQQAHRGTLFLDEIANLNREGQGQILRVLEDGCFTPLGGKTSIRTDVRLIFATNKNLKKEWGEGRFMEDLYHRVMSGGIIRLIPLQKRAKEDRQLITDHLLRKNTRRDSIPRLTEEALEWIFEQPWPGNVRELDGVLYRSLTNHPEVPTIQREHLVQAVDTESPLLPDEPMRQDSSPLLSPEVVDPLTTQLSDEEFMGKFCGFQGAIGQLAAELGQHRDRVTLRVKGLAFEAICQGGSPPNYEECCERILRGHALSRLPKRKLEKKLRGYWDTLVRTCQDCPSPDEAIASIFKQNENMLTRKHYLRDLEPFIKQHYSSLNR